MAEVTRIWIVYDADKGLWGEVRYALGKYLAGRSCDLCSITHGATSEKDSWTTCKATYGVPIETAYRNELTDQLAEAVDGSFPCVVAETPTQLVRVIDPSDLAALGGDVERLDGLLRDRLLERDLQLPT